MSNKDLDTILEAASLTPTSYGLQPFKIIVIENPEIREKLKLFAWGQSQITEASHLIAIVNYTTFGDALIDD